LTTADFAGLILLEDQSRRVTERRKTVGRIVFSHVRPAFEAPVLDFVATQANRLIS
jgi:hypothetical protein